MYEGKLVRLREHRLEEAEQLLKWLNDLDTARRLGGGGMRPYTLEEEKTWIGQNAGHQPSCCNFAVETLDGRLIGGCGYHELDWHNRRCMVGWFIGDPQMRGHGYGTDMIKTLLDVCFLELGLHKVSLNVFGFNDAAIRLYERLGFTLEGSLRKEVYSMGCWWDEYRYGMLREEYDKIFS